MKGLAAESRHTCVNLEPTFLCASTLLDEKMPIFGVCVDEELQSYVRIQVALPAVCSPVP